MGGMIGQGDEFSVTGGWSLAIPQYGFYWLAPDGWAPENRGVEPDYTVELKPWPLTGGRDPQLEKAIELSLGALATYRLQIPVPPPYGGPE
jgi:C-terminal processing protease CtpA/Prc